MPRSTKSILPTAGGFKAPEGFDNRRDFGQSLLDNVVGGNLSGIVSTKPTAKYASGARCVLKMNGKIVGFAFAVSWRINTMNVEINTIDDYAPYELAPQRVTVEGTISMLHIPRKSAGSELWQPDMFSFLFHKYIRIEVRDSETDELLFATGKAVIVSRSEEHKVDQLANVTLNWKAIGFMDERVPEEPEGHDGNQPVDSSQSRSVPSPTIPSFPAGSTDLPKINDIFGKNTNIA